MDQRVRNGFGMVLVHYIYLCTYFYYYLHLLHLRSSGVRSQRLGTPDVKNPLERHVKVFKSEWIAQ